MPSAARIVADIDKYLSRVSQTKRLANVIVNATLFEIQHSHSELEDKAEEMVHVALGEIVETRGVSVEQMAAEMVRSTLDQVAM